MKPILFALWIFGSITLLNAQQQTDSIAPLYHRQNEVKLNGILLLLGSAEASYEHNLNDESSVGISFLVPYDKEFMQPSINYYVAPYYRVFFGEKYAAGFFVEGFAMLNSSEREKEITPNDGYFYTEEKTVTDLAVGIGLGGKWVTKSGFVFELINGIGRNLFNTDFDDPNIVGKFGFNLGYRF